MSEVNALHLFNLLLFQLLLILLSLSFHFLQDIVVPFSGVNINQYHFLNFTTSILSVYVLTIGITPVRSPTRMRTTLQGRTESERIEVEVEVAIKGRERGKSRQ